MDVELLRQIVSELERAALRLQLPASEAGNMVAMLTKVRFEISYHAQVLGPV